MCRDSAMAGEGGLLALAVFTPVACAQLLGYLFGRIVCCLVCCPTVMNVIQCQYLNEGLSPRLFVTGSTRAVLVAL